MGYRAPSFKELYLRVPEPRARGTRSSATPTSTRRLSLSVPARHRVAGAVGGCGWGPTRYVNRLRNLITASTSAFRRRLGDVAVPLRERRAARAPPASRCHAVATRGRAGLEVGWAFTRTRETTTSISQLDGMPDEPGDRDRAVARSSASRLDAFVVDATFTGHRPYYLTETDPDGRDADRAARRAARPRSASGSASGVGGFLGIDNALDTGDADLNPVQPRTIYAGMELHL